jgi:cardiolipin synthase
MPHRTRRLSWHDVLQPLIWAGLLALGACTSMPEVAPDVGRVSSVQPAAWLVGARGPLSPAESSIALLRQSADAGDAALLRRHVAAELDVAESAFTYGNRTRVLPDGGAAFRAIFDGIRRARHSINLEYYILEDVAVDGQGLGDLLVAKRRAGVAVNIIYDSYGSGDTRAAFFARLRAAGVRLLDYNPLNPLEARVGYAPNDRDHRKILVVDGREAIVGGINLSTAYKSNSIGKSGTPEEKAGQPWVDTDIEIAGPAVAELQALFVHHWRRQVGEPLDVTAFFPRLAPQGRDIVRIIGSSPKDAQPRYYLTLLAAIRSAERRVWLSEAYFVPTDQEIAALVAAARRGVDVRLLLTDESNSDFAIAVAHSHYGELLDAGVRIYETVNEVLHSKTAAVDGVWSAIGSSNFDRRSILYNDEVDAIVLGSTTARELEAIFERNLRKARPIDREEWTNRPLGDRLGELFARLWQNLL